MINFLFHNIYAPKVPMPDRRGKNCRFPKAYHKIRLMARGAVEIRELRVEEWGLIMGIFGIGYGVFFKSVI